MAPVISSLETSVGFQNPDGSFLAFGFITLDLSHATIVDNPGDVADVVQTRLSYKLDANGKIVNQPVNFYSNDTMLPAGTTYRLRVYNSNGLLVADWGNLALNSLPTYAVDLATVVPTS